MSGVLGVDQSISDSGLCYRWGEHEYLASHFKTDLKNWRGRDFQRKLYVVAHIRKMIEDIKPEVFVMEEYARAVRNSSSIIPLVELGALIKRVVYAKKIPLVIVSTTGLKQFATGHGGCKKPVVMKEVYKRWGFDTNNDNEADSFVLALMGYYYAQAVKTPDPRKYIKKHPVLTVPQKEAMLTLLEKKED